ncbi:MAG: PEGA domain-containing protein [Nannocystaceae bacterium]
MMGSAALLLAFALGPADADDAPTGPKTEPTATAGVIALAATVSGNLTQQWRDALATALREGLSRGRFRLIELPPDAASCDALACVPEATRAQARYLVHDRIELVDRNYAFSLELIDLERGEVVATASGSCEICGLADAGTELAALAASLRDKIDRLVTAPPTVRIETTPTGARVLVDGIDRGVSPIELDTVAGHHRIEVRKPGHLAATRELELVDGVRERVLLELTPAPAADAVVVPPPQPHADDGRSARRAATAAGAVLLGVGVAVAAGGAALWGIDSRGVGWRCSGEDRDAFGHCRYLYDTRSAGIAMVVGGATAAITGAIVLGLRERIAHRKSRR